MKVAFLLNPGIKKLHQIKETIARVFADIDHAVFLSRHAGDFMANIDAIIAKGYTTLIATGGDGTLNEVLNGIINTYTDASGVVDWEKISGIKLGVFAAGTGNDFIRNIKDPSPEKIRENILNNHSTKIDLGFVQCKGFAGKTISRYFINVADAGIGAAIVLKEARIAKVFSDSLSYKLAIISTMPFYNKNKITVYGDGFEWSGKAMSCIVANGKYFGDGMGIAPTAALNDGLLDITLIGDVSLIDYAKQIPLIKKAVLVKHPQVKYFKTQSLRIESNSGQDVAFEMDGEFVGYTPVALSCKAAAIHFLL